MIGEVSEERRKLVEVTKECVELGIKAVKPWGFLGDIANVIQKHAYANGFFYCKRNRRTWCRT